MGQIRLSPTRPKIHHLWVIHSESIPIQNLPFSNGENANRLPVDLGEPAHGAMHGEGARAGHGKSSHRARGRSSRAAGQGEGARTAVDMGKELTPPLGRTSRAAGKEPYLRAPPGRREVAPVRAAGKKQRPVRGQRPARRRGGEEPDLAQPDLGPRAAGEGAAAGDGAAELGRPPANARDLHAGWRCVVERERPFFGFPLSSKAK